MNDGKPIVYIQSGTCAFSTAKVPQAKVMSYTVVAKNATQMQAALVTYGPISVSLWANVSNIYNYKYSVVFRRIGRRLWRIT